MVATVMLLMGLLFVLAGCGSEFFDDDCSHQMDDLRDARGEPDRVTAYDSDDYHSHTWWYGRFARTFTWGDHVEGACETSDFRY